LEGTREASTRQAKEQPVEDRRAMIETVTVKEMAVAETSHLTTMLAFKIGSDVAHSVGLNRRMAGLPHPKA
jgi:hypothetical protein